MWVHREAAEVLADPGATELTPGSIVWGRFRFDVTVSDKRPVIPLSPWAAVIPLGGRENPVVRSTTQEESKLVGAHAGRPWPAVELAGEVRWIPDSNPDLT